jgi:hypothetical protein
MRHEADFSKYRSMSAYIGVSITMAIISLGLLDHLKEPAGANFCLFEVAGMQLMIRTRVTARGRTLAWSHWRLKTVAQRPSLPVRQPPYDADFSSLFSNGGIVRGTEAKPLAAYRRRLCCVRRRHKNAS